MVRKCIICGAPQSKSSLLSFHRFPANKELAAKWLAVCHLTENNIKKDTLICSKHFVIDDYDELSVWPHRKLRISAIPAPSLLQISTHSSYNNAIANSEGAADVMEIDSKPDADTLTQSLKEYISQLSKNDFNKLCRACLALEETAFVISDVTYENINLWEIFENCVTVQMDDTDNFPKYICQSCTAALIQGYAFKQQCQQSNDILQTVILKQNSDSCKNEEDVANDKVAEETTKTINTENEASCLRPCLDVYPKQIKLEANLSTEKVEMQNQNIEDKVGIKMTSCESKSKKARFTCKHCNETFDMYNELKAHRQKHPSIRRPKICSECGKSVMNLTQHMQIHKKEKPYFCHVCGDGFTLKYSLRRHMLRHSGERPYTCDICGNGFAQTSTLLQHKRTHTGEKPFLCSYCGLGFVRVSRYKDHLITEHQQNCGKDFINNKGSDIDEKTFLCNYCGMRFARLSRYNAHLITKHHVNSRELNNHNFNFECDVCKKRFKTKISLDQHMLRHGDRRFLCSHCGKGFVSNYGLHCHMTVHTGVRPFACKICKKGFTQFSSMRTHMRIHTGEKRFICKVCSKAFTQSNHLQYHMRTHSGEKPYVCNHCNKSFALKGTLTVHIRTHTGETPYICDVCDKGFYDSSTMKKHKRGHGQLEEKLIINTSDTDTHT